MIELATRFGIFDSSDDVEPGDTLTLVGREQRITVDAPDGYESFLSTVAMACNTVTAVAEADPGFRTLLELPVSALASKGSRMT